MRPRTLGALLALSLVALALVVLAARARHADDQATVNGEPTAGFAGSQLPKGVRAPNFSLRDQYGRTVSMRALRGRPVVVSFMYTHCHDTCPAQAQQIRGGLDDLGHDLPALAISVDPPRDTPASARAFLAKQRIGGRIRFVLGSRPQLKRLWRAFGIRPQAPDAEHMSRITLIDRRGFQRIGFPGEQATPERLAHDLRMLERE